MIVRSVGRDYSILCPELGTTIVMYRGLCNPNFLLINMRGGGHRRAPLFDIFARG